MKTFSFLLLLERQTSPTLMISGRPEREPESNGISNLPKSLRIRRDRLRSGSSQRARSAGPV